MKEICLKTLVCILSLGFTLTALTSCGPVKFYTQDKITPPAPTPPPACPVPPCIVTPPGLTHTAQEQRFFNTNKVDILVITDNSRSMTEEQKLLSSPFNGFIGNLNSAGIDWQIGVTTTDVCSQSDSIGCGSGVGANGAFIGPVGSNPSTGNQYIIKKSGNQAGDEQLFASTVQRGTDLGSGDERGLYALNLAIDKRLNENAGFFRDNSALAVVLLSDENERSDGGTNQSGQLAPLSGYDMPQPLVAKVNSTWNGEKPFQFNSIIIKPDDQACLNTNSTTEGRGFYGTVYNDLSNLTSGAVGSICETSPGAFAEMLKKIASAIQQLPNSKTIILNNIPAAQPVISFVPAQPGITASWVPGSNRIELSQRPGDGVVVHVEYDYDAKAQKVTTAQNKVAPAAASQVSNNTPSDL